MKIASVVLAALVVAGCQAGTTSDKSQWISSEQADQEYKDEARRHTLAPGWKWPKGGQYRSHASDGRKINYGINTGKVDATWYWHCTWARSFFAATSSAERDAALLNVLELKKSAFYRYGLAAEDKSPRDRILALAESGETEPLHDIIESNCPRKDWNFPAGG